MKTFQTELYFHVYLPGKQEAYQWKPPHVPLSEGPISSPLGSLNFVSIVLESLSRFNFVSSDSICGLKAGSQLLQVTLGTPESQEGGQDG